MVLLKVCNHEIDCQTLLHIHSQKIIIRPRQVHAHLGNDIHAPFTNSVSGELPTFPDFKDT